MVAPTPAPVYPTRRARHQAEAAARAAADRHPGVPRVPAAAAPQTTGAAVSPPAIPVHHRTTGAAASPSAAPVVLRRDVHRDGRTRTRPRGVRPRSRPVARPWLCGAVSTAVGAARDLGPVRSLPTTSTALVATLVVSVAVPTPAAAALRAAPTGTGTVQSFAVSATPTVDPVRDDFRVVRDVVTVPAVVRPVDGSIPTAGGFGGRLVAGCGACSTDHHGLDFAAPLGADVLAVLPGRVEAVGRTGGYGNQVLLAHADGTRTRYAHLSRADVVVGQAVTAGQRIGAVGSTGVSTGPHLHFEVLVGGRATDPAPWLAARGVH